MYRPNRPCISVRYTPTRSLQEHTHTRTDEGLTSTMRVKRPHTSLLAAGAMLMATADDGFWEDEDEAHDWTCVGVALMAVACVKGKRPYGPDGGGEPRPLI